MRDARESRIRQVEAQRQCDKFKISHNQLRKMLDQLQAAGVSVPETESMDALGSEDVIQGYLDRIAELEEENRCLRDLRAISKDFMQRTSGASTSARTSLATQRGSYAIPELEEVDQDLVNEQLAAAEEEEYR